MKRINNWFLMGLLLTLSMTITAAPIHIKTNKKAGEEFFLALNSGLNVTVAWNNGKTDTFVSDGMIKTLTVKAEEAEIAADADITSVYMANNGITEMKLDITANSIEKLYCPQNELTSLDLSYCQQLIALNCQGNHLENVVISSQVLEECDLSDNQLKTITLATDGKYLNTLALSGNQLNNLDVVKNFTQLKALFVADNQLSQLSLENNKLMRTVVANANQLDTLKTAGLKELRQMWLSNNKLVNLDLEKAMELNSLIAKDNKLQDIHWGYQPHTALQLLDVQNNHLFFNSFPSINEENKSLTAYLLPQNPHFIAEKITEDRTYDQWASTFTQNGWGEPTNLKVNVADEKGALSTPADYTLEEGKLYVKVPHKAIHMTATTASYPGMELSIAPFEVEEFKACAVTFNYIYNGKSAYQEKEIYEIGTVISELPNRVKNEFCKYEFETTTLTQPAQTIDVKINWNGPFEFSESYEDAIWYNLLINVNKQNKGYANYNGEKPLNLNTLSNVSSSQWAFIGCPAHFEIVNQAAGKDVALQATPDYPQLKEGQTAWEIVSADENNTYFLFHNETYGYVDFNNTEIAYTKGKAPNSQMTTKEAPMSNEAKVARDIAPFFQAEPQEGYFNITKEAYAQYKDKVAAAVKNCDGKTYNELNKMMEENMKMPKPGYYRIKNVATGKYLQALSMDELHCNGEANTISTIIELQEVLPPGSGQTVKKPYFLSQGYWMGNTYNGFPKLNKNKGNYVQYLPLAPGQFAFAVAYYNGIPPYEEYLEKSYYTAGEADKVFGSQKTPKQKNTESLWTIEEATSAEIPLKSIGEKSYATTYLSFPATFSNVTANAVSNEGDVAKLEAISGNLPAKTAVLLVSEQNDASAHLDIVTETVRPVRIKNILTGSFFDYTLKKGDLLLGEKDGKAGFFTTEETVMKMNEAYISVRKASENGYVIDVNTGIEDLLLDQMENAEIYDLQGRKVSKPTRGMYIVNGKKLYLK